jgi:hypothetical protein
MRIYIFHTLQKNGSWLNKLEPYLVETRRENYIWSQENGPLKIKAQKIYRVRIKDVPVIKTLLGAFPATIDKSEFICDDEECHQIPPNSYQEQIEIKVYKLSAASLSAASLSNVEWIFEYKNGELYDHYFYSKEEDINKIKAEVLQFLLL